MRNKFLSIASSAVLLAVTLTSCGDRVAIMNDETEDVQSATMEVVKGHIAELDSHSAEAPTDKTQTITQEAEEDDEDEYIFATDYELPAKSVIDGFQTVMQNPELPTGCEVTALAQTLNFLGFDVDKVDLCDNYMKIDMDGEYTMDEAYIGDPHSYSGFGCSSPVICDTAEKYFKKNGKDAKAVDLSGTEFRDLFYQIDQGRPVIVWATMYLMDSAPEYVYTAKNGEDMWFVTYQHCLTLYGYDLDQNLVYVADPLVGNTTYDLSRFEYLYSVLGQQGVIITGDSVEKNPVTRVGKAKTTTSTTATTATTAKTTTTTTTTATAVTTAEKKTASKSTAKGQKTTRAVVSTSGTSSSNPHTSVKND